MMISVLAHEYDCLRAFMAVWQINKRCLWSVILLCIAFRHSVENSEIKKIKKYMFSFRPLGVSLVTLNTIYPQHAVMCARLLTLCAFMSQIQRNLNSIKRAFVITDIILTRNVE